MKGTTTREKIIEQSSELFNTYGYHACSLNHIMEATQLKKGGIYNHFKNKDEIAVEAFNYNYNRVLKRFRDKLNKDHTSYEKLISVIDVFVSFVDDPLVRGGGCPIFNTAMDATNTHPELKRKAQEGIQGLKKYIEIKLQEGIERGEFRSDIKIKQVSTLLIASLEGAIVMSRVEDSKECVEYASEYLKGYIKTTLLNNHPFNSPPLKGGDAEGRGGNYTYQGGMLKTGEVSNSTPSKVEAESSGGIESLGNISSKVEESRERNTQQIHNREYLKEFRKELRENATAAERTLWGFLKNKQQEGRKFRRQHSVNNFILDFYCPTEKLAIELDGAGHYSRSGDVEDYHRDHELESLGITVLRFENEEVFKRIEAVLEVIKSHFKPPL